VPLPVARVWDVPLCLSASRRSSQAPTSFHLPPDVGPRVGQSNSLRIAPVARTAYAALASASRGTTPVRAADAPLSPPPATQDVLGRVPSGDAWAGGGRTS
jgi:hypothetical protein